AQLRSRGRSERDEHCRSSGDSERRSSQGTPRHLPEYAKGRGGGGRPEPVQGERPTCPYGQVGGTAGGIPSGRLQAVRSGRRTGASHNRQTVRRVVPQVEEWGRQRNGS